MKKLLIFVIIVCSVLGVSVVARLLKDKETGAPPYAAEDLEPPDMDPYAWMRDWVRPDGPPKVGLQVGHWKNDELPEELERLIGRTGSSGGGKSEWEVNLKIAEETKKILEEKGIQVELLPATVPEDFWADAFVSIHADGSESPHTTGYKAAAPRRDFSGKAEKLVELIEEEYEKATGLVKDPNVTRNMRGYYAFAWWRYDHAVHPMTPSVILETGFLTNPSDRKTIVDKPEISAQGLAAGILNYLQSEQLLGDFLSS